MRLFKSHTPKSPPRSGAGPSQTASTVPDQEKAGQDKARPKEIGGPSGPEPTRYGDWERNGICSDF